MKVFNFLFLILLVNSALSQSIEQGNAFSKFMGAEDGVNPISGSVSFKKNIATISSGNASYNVEMSYSSNVEEIVKNKNDIAQTGWVGLGWNLGHAKITSDNAGTMWIDDDAYYLQTSSGIKYKIIKDGEKWWIEGLPYWRLEQKLENVTFTNKQGKQVSYLIIVGWKVTNDMGVVYTYGDLDYDRENPLRNATEYTIANPYPNGIVGVYENGQDALFPNVWNLSRIEDFDGNNLTFEYDQSVEKVKTHIPKFYDMVYNPDFYTTNNAYTKECYLKSIKSSQGDKIEFVTKQKNYDREFIDVRGKFERDESSEIDAYIDPLERRFLTQMIVYGKDGKKLKYIDFCYEPLYVRIDGVYNPDYVKRLLTSVVETGAFDGNHVEVGTKGAGEEIQKETYAYIKDDLDRESGSPLPLGALDSIVGPNCGVVKFKYKDLTLVDVDYLTGVHKDVVPLVKTAVGQLEDGTNYIVGINKKTGSVEVYFRRNAEWRLQQTLASGREGKFHIGDRNWFAYQSGEENGTYFIYVWNGQEWKLDKTFTDYGSYDKVAVGPGYLLTAHVADDAIRLRIPWAIWKKGGDDVFSHRISWVDDDKDDRKYVQLMASKNHFGVFYKQENEYFNSGALRIYSFTAEKNVVETRYYEGLDDDNQYQFLSDNVIVGVTEGKGLSGYYAKIIPWRENDYGYGEWYDRFALMIDLFTESSVDFVGGAKRAIDENVFNNLLLNGKGLSVAALANSLGSNIALGLNNLGISLFFSEPLTFKLNGWQGTSSIQATGEDYFAVKHNDNDDMSLFDYDGLKWKTVYSNRNMVHHQDYDPKTEAEWDAKPGYNFFVARKPRIRKHWYGNEIKPFREFQLYEKVNNVWQNGETYSSGDKKNVYAGSNWYLIKEGQTGHIRNGYNWNDEDYSKLATNVKGSFLRNDLKKESLNGDFFIEETANSTYIYYKKNDSFKSKIKGFFVVEKNVKDPVVDKVVTYQYDYISNSLEKPPTYDYVSKAPIVYAYVVRLPENAGVIEKVLCDYQERKAVGEVCEEIYYDSPTSKRIIKSVKKEHERYYSDNWPKYIYLDRTVSTTVSVDNLSKTEKYYYANGINDMVSKAVLYDGNTGKSISENVNVFAAEINKYKDLLALNRLGEKVATYQCKPDCKNGVVVSGNVTTYTNKDNGVWRADAHWAYTPKGSGNDRDKSFSFNWDYPMQSSSWTKVDQVENFYKGLANETVDQFGLKNSVIFENDKQNYPLVSIKNAGLKEVLVLPGDGCNVENWTECHFMNLAGGRALGKNVTGSESAYGRFAKTAILVNKQYSLKGKLREAKKSKYRFSAWIQGTSYNANPDKIQLLVSSFKPIEYDLKGHGEWQYVEKVFETKSGAEYSLTLFTNDDTEIHLQDVRFVPENANVEVTFWDKHWSLPVAKVDDRGVGAYMEYDDLGRVVGLYSETADGKIVQKTKTSYIPGICSISFDKRNALKMLNVNGENLAISTNPGTIEVVVPNNTDDLNISWKSFVDGEKVFYSLHKTDENPDFVEDCCVGASGVSKEFDGTSMTLDIAVSTLDKPYKVIINKSTIGWVDHGKPLTEGFNPIYLSNNNVLGATYLTDKGLKNVAYVGTDWNGGESEKREGSFSGLASSIYRGNSYIFAIPENTGNFLNATHRNALVFKNALNVWNNFEACETAALVSSDFYRMTTSNDDQMYVLYLRNQMSVTPKSNGDGSATVSVVNDESLIVKKMVSDSWVDLGTVAKISGTGVNVAKQVLIDDDIAVGEYNIPYVAYIARSPDYTIQEKFVYDPYKTDLDVNDDVSNKCELYKDTEDKCVPYESHPVVVIVKHYDSNLKKWIGFSSESGDVLENPNGTYLSNASKVKLASDGNNLYMAVLYNDGLSSQYALKVYKLIKDNSKLKFVEMIDRVFGSAIIAYLDENDHFDMAVHQDIPYVSFVNSANMDNMTVVKFVENQWKSVGLPAFVNVSKSKNNADLAIGLDGQPYVILQEGSSSKNVKRRNKIVPMKYSVNEDLDLTISSIGEIPEMSLHKNFRQYIISYKDTVPMTVKSIPLNLVFSKIGHVAGIFVENNEKPIFTWSNSKLLSNKFIMNSDVVSENVPVFNVPLNVGPNEIKVHIYGSERITSLIYSFNIECEYISGFDFNIKDMGRDLGTLVCLGSEYQVYSSSSEQEQSYNSEYNLGNEFNPRESSNRTIVTSVDKFEYRILPPTDGTKSEKFCLEYNSSWFMQLDQALFTKPICLVYDFENDKIVMPPSSGVNAENSSSSVFGNQIVFSDEKGNKKIVDIIVISSSSYSEGFSSSGITDYSSSFDPFANYSSSFQSSSSIESLSSSSSSKTENIEGTAIPNEYSSLYGYNIAGATNIYFENNVNVSNGDYVASNVDVASNAQILGRVQSYGNMVLNSNAYVYSVVLGGTINMQAGASYESLEQKNVTVPYIPRLSINVGSEPINVWAGQSVTLYPGDYGDVAIYTNANVTFEPGAYHFNSLYVAPKVNIGLGKINSPIQIFVQNSMRIDDNATFMVGENPKNIFVYGNGFFDMYIGVRTKISATIAYPNGKVNIAPYAEYSGSIWSNSVVVGANAIVR